MNALRPKIPLLQLPLPLLLPLLLLLPPFTPLQAQVLQPGFSVGLHAGGSKAYTDVTNADIKSNFGAGFQYNLTSFTFANLEYSTGRLARQELDLYGKSFNNSYHRLTATTNISLGQLLKPGYRTAHYLIYNIYAGTGIGVIMSNIAEPNALTFDNFGGITYKGIAPTVPINLGFNFKFASYIYPNSPLNLNVNLQHNFTFTEMLDGYNPDNSDNKMKDSFTGVSVGLKYNFGKKEEF